jgi:hypothetical protein
MGDTATAIANALVDCQEIGIRIHDNTIQPLLDKKPNLYWNVQFRNSFADIMKTSPELLQARIKLRLLMEPDTAADGK